MHKRVLAVLLVASMCFSIVACEKSDSSRRTRSRDDDGSGFTRPSVTEAEAVEETEATVTTTIETETQPTGIEYSINQVLSVVSEDRLWVEYSNGSTNDVIALIDTEGHEKFSVTGDLTSYSVLPEGSGFCDYSDMHNGAAYVRDNNSGTIYIIDSDGNVLNSFDDSSDTHYSMIGTDNGYFLIYEFSSSISSNTHKFHIVDPTGAIIYSRDLSDADSSYSTKNELYVHADLVDDLTFLVRFQSGSLYSDDMFLVQMDVPNIVYVNSPDYANTLHGTEGYFVDDCWRTATVVPMDTYADDAAFAALMENFEENGYSISTEDERLFTGADYGYVFFESYDYNVSPIYDLEAQDWVSILSFPEGVTINNIMCYDGYCFYQLTGNDGNRYVTTADTEGNMLYEPIQSPFNDYAILNLDGSTVFSSDVNLFLLESGDTVGVNNLPDNFELRVNHRFQDNAIYMTSGISDGYVIPVSSYGTPNSVQSLDGNVVISTVIVDY